MNPGSQTVEPVTAQAFGRAVQVLRSGGIVAFPTETYYGLAVDPFNVQALERLFLLKARPQVKPVLVLVRDQADIALLAEEIPPGFTTLMHRFWPGPLTMIFPALHSLPWQLTAHSQGIGLRQSPHPVAQRLVTAFGGPLTATSANRSGEPPAVTAREAWALFANNEGLVLDGGTSTGGSASTVVALSTGRLCCIREGKIPYAEVEAVYLQR